ncbi:MAG: protein translocase subunit SecF [Bacillota bacterium]
MSFLSRIRYMKYAKGWVMFSLVLTLVSLVTLLTVGLNKGIDFTGGTLLDVQFEQQLTLEQVNEAVRTALGTDNIQVQNAEVKGAEWPNASEFFIRTPELTEQQREGLEKAFAGLGNYKKISEDGVSASVSAELTQRAVLAIAIAAVLQVIYITIRFQFKFGITAVLALLHDVAITLGLMAVFRVQINSAFVAAILTVLGYSMNDTVVVIDRIRENLGKRQKGETLEEMTTRSMQEVIFRSLATGVSVQMMLIAMLIWGGDSVWDFAMTLLIGITSGTYSSIFIAAALWLFWEQWEEKRRKAMGRSKPARA